VQKQFKQFISPVRSLVLTMVTQAWSLILSTQLQDACNSPSWWSEGTR